ncbi:MAG: Rpn family recombination-promoting nuclease/putative transposase [Blastocatellia bacterium]
MAEITTPHDSFFKRLFGDPAVAADFMRCYLPAEILSRLDLDTLELEKESFVDPELRQHFSDLLFRVKTVTQSEVFIYLLLEHKSAPEPWVAFQLLRYIVQFWERRRSQGCERLPLIIPIVFYHGQERWNVPLRLSALIESAGGAELLKYAPDYEYDLRDLSASAGAEIKGQPRLRTGLELLRHIFSDDLGRRLPQIFRNLREMNRADALEYARTLLAYLSSAGRKVNKEVVKEAMQDVLPYPDLEFDKSALFIQEWMEEGREEGIQIGEHKALCSLTLRLIHHLLGEIDSATQERIQALPNHKLEELGEALLDFTSLDDLNKWLNDNSE